MEFCDHEQIAFMDVSRLKNKRDLRRQHRSSLDVRSSVWVADKDLSVSNTQTGKPLTRFYTNFPIVDSDVALIS